MDNDSIKMRISFMRDVTFYLGKYLNYSKPITAEAHKHIESIINKNNDVLSKVDNHSNDDTGFKRINKLYDYAIERKCFKPIEAAILYAEYALSGVHPCYKDGSDIIIHLTPDDFSDDKKSESKVEPVKEAVKMERKFPDDYFLGTVSAAILIKEVNEFISKYSLKNTDIDFSKYLDKDNNVSLVSPEWFDGDMCLLSYEEWKQLFDLEKTVMKMFTEYCFYYNVIVPIRDLKDKRTSLLSKFYNAVTEEERSNLRFAIIEIDKQINSFYRED